MQDFNLLGRTDGSASESLPCGFKRLTRHWLAGPSVEDIGCPHRPKIANKAVQRAIADLSSVHVDYRHGESGAREEVGKAGSLYAGVSMRACPAHRAIGSKHRPAQPAQAVASRNGAEQQSAILQDQVQRSGSKGQVVRGIEQADGQAKVEASRFDRQ